MWVDSALGKGACLCGAGVPAPDFHLVLLAVPERRNIGKEAITVWYVRPGDYLVCVAWPLPAHNRTIGFTWTERLFYRRAKQRREILSFADSDYSRVPREPQRTARHH
jgi:hypothetical protein